MRKEFSKYTGQKRGTDTSSAGASEEEILTAFAKKYEGKSEKDLIAEILAVAKESRKKGTLSDAEIDRYVQMLAPMLGEEKRKKLFAVSKKLKEDK